ncbi:annexin A13-like isoform X2 [Dermacentor andersoni]|uniref:annexin A13-like isoform X2 n=1 Tax=Dermacentor andersoni TaxID=34620 RepID=UPI003B3B5664
MLQTSQEVHCFRAGPGAMGTSGNANRGHVPPPYSPRYTTSSPSYPAGPLGSVSFDDPQRPPAASGAPPPGFVVSSSAAPAGGYPPTMSSDSTAGYYSSSSPGGYPPSSPGGYPPSQPGGYPRRSSSMAMLMPGAPPLYSLHGSPSLPDMPTQARSFPTPSLSSTSIGYPTDPYPPPSALPPASSRPGYEPPTAAGYPMSGYSSSGRAATGYSTLGYACPESGAQYASASSGTTSGGTKVYEASPGYYGGSGARTSCYSPGRGTIKTYRNFDVHQDVDALRKALKGWTTDHAAVIDILCARSDYQRQEIVKVYKQSFGRDLMGDTKSTMRSNFEDIIIGLLYPLHEYLARELRKAIAGLGTDEECLIEILCTHSNEDIRLIKDYYHRIFNKELEKDIIGDTSGDFRRLLVSMCNGQREEHAPLDPARARSDANLYRAGVLRWGTDVSAFNRIIANQSYEQLRLVFREYNTLANHTVMEAIKSEMSGDLRRGFLAIVKCVYSPPFYFAEKLYHSIKGLGTNDKVLKRVILSRCERDLELIKEEFLDKYKMTLASAIQSDTSGNYRKALLAIVGGN